jgi:hypothetical protein
MGLAGPVGPRVDARSGPPASTAGFFRAELHRGSGYGGAKPKIYEPLEQEGIQYAIRLPVTTCSSHGLGIC